MIPEFINAVSVANRNGASISPAAEPASPPLDSNQGSFQKSLQKQSAEQVPKEKTPSPGEPQESGRTDQSRFESQDAAGDARQRVETQGVDESRDISKRTQQPARAERQLNSSEQPSPAADAVSSSRILRVDQGTSTEAGNLTGTETDSVSTQPRLTSGEFTVTNDTPADVVIPEFIIADFLSADLADPGALPSLRRLPTDPAFRHEFLGELILDNSSPSPAEGVSAETLLNISSGNALTDGQSQARPFLNDALLPVDELPVAQAATTSSTVRTTDLKDIAASAVASLESQPEFHELVSFPTLPSLRSDSVTSSPVSVTDGLAIPAGASVAPLADGLSPDALRVVESLHVNADAEIAAAAETQTSVAARPAELQLSANQEATFVADTSAQSPLILRSLTGKSRLPVQSQVSPAKSAADSNTEANPAVSESVKASTSSTVNVNVEPTIPPQIPATLLPAEPNTLATPQESTSASQTVHRTEVSQRSEQSVAEGRLAAASPVPQTDDAPPVRFVSASSAAIQDQNEAQSERAAREQSPSNHPETASRTIDKSPLSESGQRSDDQSQTRVRVDSLAATTNEVPRSTSQPAPVTPNAKESPGPAAVTGQSKDSVDHSQESGAPTITASTGNDVADSAEIGVSLDVTDGVAGRSDDSISTADSRVAAETRAQADTVSVSIAPSESSSNDEPASRPSSIREPSVHPTSESQHPEAPPAAVPTPESSRVVASPGDKSKDTSADSDDQQTASDSSQVTQQASAAVMHTSVVTDEADRSVVTAAVTTNDSPDAVASSPSIDTQLNNPTSATAASGGSGPVAPVATGTSVRQAAPALQAAVPMEIQEAVSAIQDATSGGSHIRVRLNPGELGSMFVDVSRSESGIVARLEVQSAAARVAVLETLPELRQSLARSGAVVDRVEVFLNDSRADSGRHDGDQSQQRNQQQRDQQSRQDRQSQDQRQARDEQNQRRERNDHRDAPHDETRQSKRQEELDVKL
ncbi:MAG: flagellar hook-length control protein FliK [Planctomycetota bacterium]|nr:flagellar hook-length control protein FliK [Planctomycetota bacterium]MDA1162068.1 flagellar hook-length control protein FliK [Planctomycetota bacterium]